MSDCCPCTVAFVVLISLFALTDTFYVFVGKTSTGEDDFTHRTISHRALLRVVARYLEDNPRPGSSIRSGDLVHLEPLTSSSLCTAYYGAGQISAIPLEEAFEEMIIGNLNIDFHQSASAEPHFNAEKINKGNLRLQNTRDTIINHLQKSEPDYPTARTLIGEYLHILQDFYSNTNWVEMNGGVAYDDLGLSDVEILPHSKPSENTCANCDGSDCDNNLIVAVDTLTSGYKSGQQTKKPKGSGSQGKCSHGGFYDDSRYTVATGGINKESRDPYYSPHNSLHEDAAVAAMTATENFFLAEGYGLRNNISDDTFLRLFNLRQTSLKSLSIAMDVTGSMSDDIEAAKQTCYRLIDERVGTVNEPANYVLAPFSDPDYGPVYVTTDPDEFRNAISDLRADGGDDCPELSMSGTVLALSNSLPGSDLFVFTDASAKDSHRTDEVIELGQARDIEVNYLLTGTCDRRRRSPDGQSSANTMSTTSGRFRTRRSLDAYQKVSTATGGVVLQVTKDELLAATEIINLSFEGAEVTILVADLLGMSSVALPVDSTVTQLKITVSTTDQSLTSISYDVIDPDGAVRNDITEVVNTGRELVLVTTFIDVGEWTLNLNDNSNWHIVVNATSPVDFLYTLYGENDAGQMVPFYGSPATNQNISILVTITGQEYVSEVSKLILTAKNGTELGYVSLTDLGDGSYLGQAKVPPEDFGLKLRGLDNNSVEFCRTKSIDVKVQSVSLTMPSGVIHSLDPAGIPLNIDFQISNHGEEIDNYTVVVEDGVFVQEFSPNAVQIEAGTRFTGYMIAAVKTTELQVVQLVLDR